MWFPYPSGARRTDPATSHEAASRVHEFAPSQHQQIIAILKANGPLTPEQIGDKMAIDAYAVRKRLPELERIGLATTTGEVKKTRSGRSQRVWEAV